MIVNNCIICGSELKDEKVKLRARMKKVHGTPQPDRIVYEAWCSNCEIYLQKSVQGKSHSNWRTSNIDPAKILAEVSTEELYEIELSIAEQALIEASIDISENWRTFISMKKIDDIILKYSLTEDVYKIQGLVIKRQGHLIGNFVYSYIKTLPNTT